MSSLQEEFADVLSSLSPAERDMVLAAITQERGGRLPETEEIHRLKTELESMSPAERQLVLAAITLEREETKRLKEARLRAEQGIQRDREATQAILRAREARLRLEEDTLRIKEEGEVTHVTIRMLQLENHSLEVWYGGRPIDTEHDDPRNRLYPVRCSDPLHSVIPAVDEATVLAAAANLKCSEALSQLRSITASRTATRVQLCESFAALMQGIIQCVSEASVVMHAGPDRTALCDAMVAAGLVVAGRDNEAAKAVKPAKPLPEYIQVERDVAARAAAGTVTYSTAVAGPDAVAPVAIVSQRAAVADLAETALMPDFKVCVRTAGAEQLLKRPLALLLLVKPRGGYDDDGRVQVMQYSLMDMLPCVDRCCAPMTLFGLCTDGVQVSVLCLASHTTEVADYKWWMNLNLQDEAGAPGPGFRAMCAVLQASCKAAHEPVASTYRVQLLHGFPRSLTETVLECTTRLNTGGRASVFALPTVAGAPASSMIMKVTAHSEGYVREVAAYDGFAAVQAAMPVCAPHLPSMIGRGVAEINGWKRLCIVSSPYGSSISAVWSQEGVKRGTMARIAVEGVLRALAGVHAHGRAHLDVRPANIVMVPHGDSLRSVLIDWNISSPMGEMLYRIGVGTFAHPRLWYTIGPTIAQYDLYSAALTYAALACASDVGCDAAAAGGTYVHPKWTYLPRRDAADGAGEDPRLLSLKQYLEDNSPEDLRDDFMSWYEALHAYCALHRVNGPDAKSPVNAALGADMYLNSFPWVSEAVQVYLDNSNGISNGRKKVRRDGPAAAASAASGQAVAP